MPRPRGVARRAAAGSDADPRAARDGAEHHRLRRRQRRPDRRPHPRAARRDPARPQRQRRRHPRRLRLGVPQPRHGLERSHGLPDIGRLHRLRAARRPHLRRERRRADDGHWRPDVLEQRQRLAAARELHGHVQGQRAHRLLPLRQPLLHAQRRAVQRPGVGRHRRRRGTAVRRRPGPELRGHRRRGRVRDDQQGVDHGAGSWNPGPGRSVRPEQRHPPGQLVGGDGQWRRSRAQGGRTDRVQHGQHRRQLVGRPGRQRQRRRPCGNCWQQRHGHRQLLGHEHLRPVHQRGWHGQDHARTATAHRLRLDRQHLRELEPQPRRRDRRRRPVGLRHEPPVPRPQVHGARHLPGPGVDRGRPLERARRGRTPRGGPLHQDGARARHARRHDHDLRRRREHRLAAGMGLGALRRRAHQLDHRHLDARPRVLLRLRPIKHGRGQVPARPRRAHLGRRRLHPHHGGGRRQQRRDLGDGDVRRRQRLVGGGDGGHRLAAAFAQRPHAVALAALHGERRHRDVHAARAEGRRAGRTRPSPPTWGTTCGRSSTTPRAPRRRCGRARRRASPARSPPRTRRRGARRRRGAAVEPGGRRDRPRLPPVRWRTADGARTMRR